MYYLWEKLSKEQCKPKDCHLKKIDYIVSLSPKFNQTIIQIIPHHASFILVAGSPTLILTFCKKDLLLTSISGKV